MLRLIQTWSPRMFRINSVRPVSFLRSASCGLALGAVVLAGAAESTQAAIVYTENFVFTTAAPGTTNGLLNNANTDNDGWAAYQGGSATLVTSVPTGGTPKIGVSNQNGVPKPTNPSAGYLFANQSNLSTTIFAAVDEFPTIIKPTTIEFKYSNSLNPETRLLVKVAGNWYASATNYTNDGGGATALQAGNTQATYNFSTAASDWRSFTLNPGSSMSLGAVLSSPLPSNFIQGIGFYFSLPGGNVTTTARIDNIEIVPEPASLALAGLGSLLILTGRRRSA